MTSILRHQLPSAVREIRFQFSPTSKPMIDFIQSTYPSLKSSNPHLPFLIRPSPQTPSRAFIRFEQGRETRIDLDSFDSAKSIEDALSKSITTFSSTS